MFQETQTLQLIAQGLEGQQLETTLDDGSEVRIGRAPRSGWAVPWDRQISREHADIRWWNGRLVVKCVESAANPIQWRGQAVRQVELALGDVFRIGQTSFRVEAPMTVDSAETGTVEFDGEIDEYSYRSGELEQVAFADPARQMALLAGLPQLITSAASDTDLAVKLCRVLLEAIPQAIAVAVLQYDAEVVGQLRGSSASSLPAPRLMRVETRDNYEGRFQPSRRMIGKALCLGESTLQIWVGGCGSHFTMSDSLDWAFCTPINAEACQGWCLYVAGQGGKNGRQLAMEEDLTPDLRFTELVAKFLGSVRQVRVLQEHKTQLSSFFSPKVIQSITGQGAGAALQPSERDISVMFCDVRGFSRKSEQHRDNLQQLLSCVRAALSAMTEGILEHDGTVADFQGDAALGFWGWPVALEQGPIPACLAALAVQAEFSRPASERPLLEGFSVGVGIAHGRAIAGQIGTRQQAKVGVFGPVVNQGSRLEGMTKQLGVGICVDEPTADYVRRLLPRDKARVRKLARVIPKGMDTAIIVSELLPPHGPACPVSDRQIDVHEAAVALVIQGLWKESQKLLATLPESGPKAFLLERMAEHGHKPPEDWSGAFVLQHK